MHEIKEDAQKVQRAFLVGIHEEGVTAIEAEEHLEELASLTDTMGVEVAGRLVARIQRPQPHFYLGSGKAEEIKNLALADECDVIIFDIELSPSQQRNWEKFTEIAVIDRQEVILDIFAGRAQTKEARLQVGLARMQYSLPRLTRAWSHLERQRGGAGMRGGAGELQLEVDRRLVMDKIAQYRRQLKEVRKQREQQRKNRGARPVPTAAIVGYTNAGKSSLLRALSGAEVFIEDKLFATLDTTTRRITLPNNQPLLLTDTVGFIRKLPHGLVEAFKATLEEATHSDFLVHVLDVTNEKVEEFYEVTNEVLRELDALDKPTIFVLNKTDMPHDPLVVARFKRDHEHVYEVSTHSGAGLEVLRNAFADKFVLPMREAIFHFPPQRFDLLNLLHTEGSVIEERYMPDGAWVQAEFPERYFAQFEQYAVEAMPAAVE